MGGARFLLVHLFARVRPCGRVRALLVFLRGACSGLVVVLVRAKTSACLAGFFCAALPGPGVVLAGRRSSSCSPWFLGVSGGFSGGVALVGCGAGVVLALCVRALRGRFWRSRVPGAPAVGLARVGWCGVSRKSLALLRPAFAWPCAVRVWSSRGGAPFLCVVGFAFILLI